MHTTSIRVTASARRMMRAGRVVEAICWIAGAALCTCYALARSDAIAGRQDDIEAFARQLPAPDRSQWSAARVHDYLAALGVESENPIAILRIQSIGLAVPVYPSDSQVSLNRGAGRIEGTSLPDRGGNFGIAGHRDGFFRALKGIHRDDVIEIRTRLKLHRYRVTRIEIVDAADSRLLADTEDPSITLVTCYPFYFVGNAPKRFVVHGAYDWTPLSTTGST